MDRDLAQLERRDDLRDAADDLVLLRHVRPRRDDIGERGPVGVRAAGGVLELEPDRAERRLAELGVVELAGDRVLAVLALDADVARRRRVDLAGRRRVRGEGVPRRRSRVARLRAGRLGRPGEESVVARREGQPRHHARHDRDQSSHSILLGGAFESRECYTPRAGDPASDAGRPRIGACRRSPPVDDRELAPIGVRKGAVEASPAVSRRGRGYPHFP